MKEHFDDDELDNLAGSPEIPDETIENLDKAISLHRAYISGPRSTFPRLTGRPMDRMPSLETTIKLLLGVLGSPNASRGSEATFVQNFVCPIINAAIGETRMARNKELDLSVNPGKCPIQSALDWYRDMPDITVNRRGTKKHEKYPLLYCEVKRTGAGRNKVLWDLVRLARFGRSAMIRGFPSALLVQVVAQDFTYMRMTREDGVFMLKKVGIVPIPFKFDDLTTFAERTGVLMKLRDDVIKQQLDTQLSGFPDI
ncbi:hypothetical protein BGX31_003006, partial [Mortierella sp. GBA43]